MASFDTDSGAPRPRPESIRDGAGDAAGPSGRSFPIAVFDWHIEEDLVFGDAWLANLFSITVEEAAEGVPIDGLLSVMHPDDMEAVRALIAEAVELRSGYRARYRLPGPGETWRWVKAFGKCFQTDGTLRLSGVIIPAEEAMEAPTESVMTLPRRELQCLNWCSEGKTNWEIGKILGISERTVEHHIASAVRRLGCTTRVQAVALALRVGLLK